MKFLFVLILLLVNFHAHADQKVVVTSKQSLIFSEVQRRIIAPLYQKFTNAFYKSCKPVSEDDYRCGEIPNGDLTFRDATQKSIFTISPQYIDNSGAHGYFPDQVKSVSMSRFQFDNTSLPEKLIWEPDQKIMSSNYMGKDMFVRLFPANNQLYGIGCFYIPGTIVHIPELKGSLRKNVDCWIDDGHFDIELSSNAADIKFDSLRTCASFSIETLTPGIARSMTYTPKLLAVQTPWIMNYRKAIVNPTVSVQSHGWCAGVWDFFGSASQKIKEAASAKIRSEIAKKINVNQEDFASGQWFTTYLSKYLHSPEIGKILGDVSHVKIVSNLYEDKDKNYKLFDSDKPEISSTEYANNAFNTCIRDSFLTNDSNIKASFQGLCEQLKNIQFLPFLSEANSVAAKCYANNLRVPFFDPNTQEQISQISACETKHLLTVKVDSIMKPLAFCYLEKWRYSNAYSCEDQALSLIAALTK